MDSKNPRAEMQKETNEDEEAYVLSPWGCLAVVMNDYNVDYSHLTPKMGEHMVNDFMETMERVGYVSRREEIQ